MSSLPLSQLLSEFGVVAFGAVVPVLPTGAAVSVAAVLGERDNLLVLLLVVAVGAAGAYVGDLITYALLRMFGETLAQKVPWLRRDAQASALETFREQLEAHETRTLLLSRLVPAGRIPVLLAAAIGGYPFRRYVIADLGAALLWSAVYAAIGLFGRSVFPEPWQAIVAAIALVLLVSMLPRLWRKMRDRSPDPEPDDAVH